MWPRETTSDLGSRMPGWTYFTSNRACRVRDDKISVKERDLRSYLLSLFLGVRWDVAGRVNILLFSGLLVQYFLSFLRYFSQFPSLFLTFFTAVFVSVSVAVLGLILRQFRD